MEKHIPSVPTGVFVDLYLKFAPTAPSPYTPLPQSWLSVETPLLDPETAERMVRELAKFDRECHDEGLVPSVPSARSRAAESQRRR